MHCQAHAVVQRLERLAAIDRSTAVLAQYATERNHGPILRELPWLRQIVRTELPPLLDAVKQLHSDACAAHKEVVALRADKARADAREAAAAVAALASDSADL